MAREPAVEPDICFVSYARADEPFALRLASDLRAHKAAVWVDQLNIRPSEPWDRAIERAIRSSRCMIVVVSPRAVASDNVADEISLAIDSGKTVIPLLIEPCALPLRLIRMHLIDATTGYDRAFRQALAEVRNASCTPRPTLQSALDGEILAAARRDLAERVGPIAGILVDRAALRARSTDELYNLLTLHIRDEDDRVRFLACLPRGATAASTVAATDPVAQPDPGPLSPIERATIAGYLTKFLGPIAPLIVNRESQDSTSLRDLVRRLAALLDSTEDRAEFLNRVAAQDSIAAF